MDVTWSCGPDGPDANPPTAELNLIFGDAALRWWSGNDWRIPTADVADEVWSQLQMAGGLALLDGDQVRPLPATKPA